MPKKGYKVITIKEDLDVSLEDLRIKKGLTSKQASINYLLNYYFNHKQGGHD